VQTSPGGADSLSPRVTVVPRSLWEAGHFGPAEPAANAKHLRSYFDSGEFIPERDFLVLLETHHPGRG